MVDPWLSCALSGFKDPVRPYSFRHHTLRWIRGFLVHFRALRTPCVHIHSGITL
ncbi:hypothetical protein RHMOL_Rhmol10G0228200 [Rhododendron molle]|uniref:Uncharacterized protein n=1 Tax=Rhododendron molle TaxID=49168 RepID=A0ACC0M678_RHOML|nr:hypothetical protein RHMOL_Rhmol10G0228200 [Rhododendron molle]